MNTINLTYADDDELKRKAFAIYMSLQTWTPYAIVRKRFAPHLSRPAFTMRLARFEKRGGTFPKQMGAAGFKILQLKVTPELAEELAK